MWKRNCYTALRVIGQQFLCYSVSFKCIIKQLLGLKYFSMYTARNYNIMVANKYLENIKKNPDILELYQQPEIAWKKDLSAD